MASVHKIVKETLKIFAPNPVRFPDSKVCLAILKSYALKGWKIYGTTCRSLKPVSFHRCFQESKQIAEDFTNFQLDVFRISSKLRKEIHFSQQKQ